MTSCFRVYARRHLKGELFAAKDEMLQEKDELFRTQLELSQLRHAAADAANELVLFGFGILGHSAMSMLFCVRG